MDPNATATAENKSDATATAAVEAPTTSLATATTEEGKQTTTAETQTTQSTEATEKKTEPGTEKTTAAGAPEKYEDFKAPEGVVFDPGVLTAFTSAAKEANLSQESAQKLIETMQPALAERQLEQVKALHQEWTNASTADPEFGGEKLKENLGVARRALDQFDPLPKDAKTTPLRTLLDTSGIGNHPEILRLLYRAGKAISEDGFVDGKPRGSGGKDATSVLYDNTK